MRRCHDPADRLLKLPSVGRLIEVSVATARRFPEVVVCAVVAGTAAVEPWFDGGLSDLDATATDSEVTGDTTAVEERRERVRRIMGALRVQPGPSDRPVRIEATGLPGAISTVGFDFMIVAAGSGEAVIDGDTLRFELSEDSLEVVMWWADREEARASLTPLIELVARRGGAPPREVFRSNRTETERMTAPEDALVLELRGKRFSARLVLRSVTVERRDGGPVATGFGFDAALLRREESLP